MLGISRRQFAFRSLAAATAAGSASSPGVLRAAGSLNPALDNLLKSGIERRNIPAVVAMVATADDIIYQGAFGKRDDFSGTPIGVDSIFCIASMTKAVTAAAVMQLVERGQVSLDEPASTYLPVFSTLPVLDGFTGAGRPMMHRVRTPVTLRHLLSHTAGFAYNVWSPKITQYLRRGGNIESTLLFEPGTGWQYGYGADWAGRIVEKVTGQTLEQYFQSCLTGPLGMADTGFSVAAARFNRMASNFVRQNSGPRKGALVEVGRKLPGPPRTFSGGGGLYGSAPDFVHFMQMILRQGKSSSGAAILQQSSVNEMASNQIGDLSAGKMKSIRPEIASDTDFHPGVEDRFGLSFLINTVAVKGGRSAGSLAWAGIDNTYFWIDLERGLCATIMMQFLPFCDREAVGLLSDFEHAVYLNT